MNKEQEKLIIEGIKLLIENNDKIRESKKQVWLYDYNKLFGEEEGKE